MTCMLTLYEKRFLLCHNTNITTNIITTSKARYNLVSTWISNSIELQTRNFFELDQLYAIFCHETKEDITLTKRSYQKHANNISERSSTFKKIHVKRNIYSYIVINENDDYFKLFKLRHNPARVRFTIPSPPPPIYSESTNNSNSKITPGVSDMIREMKKSDLPMALSFFFGKDKAKEIKKEEEDNCSNIERVPVKYGNIVKDHLKAQVIKLNQAFISFTDGKTLLVTVIRMVFVPNFKYSN